MREVLDAPKLGQFVAMWEFDNTIWSCTYKYKNGHLLQYVSDIDEWDRVDIDLLWPFNNDGCKFYIAKNIKTRFDNIPKDIDVSIQQTKIL